MKIHIQHDKINSVLSVIVSTTDWTLQELDLIVEQGEPTIQIGGTFEKIPSTEPCPRAPRYDYDMRLRLFFDKLDSLCVTDLDSGYKLANTFLDLKKTREDSSIIDSNDVIVNPDRYFTLPEFTKKIKTDFPILMEFSEDDFDDPALCAKIWADTIVKRIAYAYNDLNCKKTPAIKEEVYNV